MGPQGNGSIRGGEGRRKSHCTLLTSIKPISFSKPATRIGRIWGLSGHLANKMGLFVVTIYLLSGFRTNATTAHNMGPGRGFIGRREITGLGHSGERGQEASAVQSSH